MDRIPLQESRRESTLGYSINTTGIRTILPSYSQTQLALSTQV